MIKLLESVSFYLHADG